MTSLQPRSSTEVALVGMRFHACVGILPHEREIPQPLEIDVTARHPERAHSVLDYRALAEAAEAVVESGPLDYLETIAEAVAVRVLALEGVSWCRIVVRKPHVALRIPLAHAQVTIERAHA